MFTIIGGDGREYGPATAEQIKRWMAAGRANFDTKARMSGSDEWRRLGDFPEFVPGAVVPPPIPTEGAPVQPAADIVQLADRSARLGAWFLDMVFSFIAILPGTILLGFTFVMALMAGQGGGIGEMESERAALGLILLFAGGLPLLIVQLWMLTTRGQTIGKKLMRIRVVKVVDGSNPGFVSAVLLRTFLPGLIGMIPFMVGFVFFLVDTCFIFRDDRRCIHDLMAGTHVVKA